MSVPCPAESVVAIDCQPDTLLGILHQPSVPAEVGVVVVVGGPQYRVGSHRQFVLLARALAEAGFAVLRFDYRGMGDSCGTPRDFRSVSPDIGAAIGALQFQVPAVRKVVLCGLCDGASAALLYVQDTHDQRIAGLCVYNPWVRSEASLARTHVKHYYAQRLGHLSFWVKLLTGRIAVSAVRELAGKLSLLKAERGQSNREDTDATFQHRMAMAWQACSAPLLLIISGQDFTGREFLEHVATAPAWAHALERPHVQRHDLHDADTPSRPAPTESAWRL